MGPTCQVHLVLFSGTSMMMKSTLLSKTHDIYVCMDLGTITQAANEILLATCWMVPNVPVNWGIAPKSKMLSFWRNIWKEPEPGQVFCKRSEIFEVSTKNAFWWVLSSFFIHPLIQQIRIGQGSWKAKVNQGNVSWVNLSNQHSFQVRRGTCL